jgi:hypothetical protein
LGCDFWVLSEAICWALRGFGAARDFEGASLEKMPRRGDRRANVVEEKRSSFTSIDGRENFRRSTKRRSADISCTVITNLRGRMAVHRSSDRNQQCCENDFRVFGSASAITS